MRISYRVSMFALLALGLTAVLTVPVSAQGHAGAKECSSLKGSKKKACENRVKLAEKIDRDYPKQDKEKLAREKAGKQKSGQQAEDAHKGKQAALKTDHDKPHTAKPGDPGAPYYGCTIAQLHSAKGNACNKQLEDELMSKKEKKMVYTTVCTGRKVQCCVRVNEKLEQCR
jgi:hypothetical protein